MSEIKYEFITICLIKKQKILFIKAPYSLKILI